MSSEGLNNLERGKHPWETLPEQEEKKQVQRERKQARKEKRKARVNSVKAWVSKHKLASAGIAVFLIAVIAGGVFFGVRLIGGNGGSGADGGEGEVATSAGEGGWPTLPIPDEFKIEEIVTPGYGYEIVWTKLYEATDAESRKNEDYEKLEEEIDKYLAENNIPEENQPAFELVKAIFLAVYGGADRTGCLLAEFDAKNLELGKNTRYIYIMAKMVFYNETGDTENKEIWEKIQDEEYPPEEGYIDVNTQEAITDEEEVKKIKADLDRIQKELDDYNASKNNSNENSEEGE